MQPGGPTNGRDLFAEHVRQAFAQQGWTVVESPLTGVGTSGVKVDQGVFDGRVTAVCVAPPSNSAYCPGAGSGTGAAGGGQPALSVAFDHDTYQGGSPTAASGGNPVRLAPGQTSAPIVAYFRNTSPANTLYRANVVLASYLPDNDQPAPLNLCNPASARQCSPLTEIWLDRDCPPQNLCSFTYTLRAPADFTGTENLIWRVMVIHPDRSLDVWINDANNQQQLEFYDVVSTPAGAQ